MESRIPYLRDVARVGVVVPKDPHQILGIPHDASEREVRRAFRALSRLRHPDVGGSDAAMKELTEAYQTMIANRGRPRAPVVLKPPRREHPGRRQPTTPMPQSMPLPRDSSPAADRVGLADHAFLDLIREGVCVLTGHRGIVTAAIFTPDGQFLVSGGMDGLLLLWGPSIGQLHSEISLSGPITSMAIHPQGRSVAVGMQSGETHIFALPALHRERSMKGHSGPVSSVCFAAGGYALISTSTDGTVRLWYDGASEVLISIPHEVTATAYHPRSESLAVGAADGLVRFWQFSNLRADLVTRATLEAGAVVRSLAFSNDFASLAVGLDRGILLRQTNQLVRLERQSGANCSLAFSSNDADLVVGAEDGSAQIWSLAEGRLRSLLVGHQGRLRSVNYSPDESLIVTGSDDQTIRLWTSPLTARLKSS